MIYTSYFFAPKAPKGHTVISVVASPPSGYDGLQYKKVAPTYDILMQYLETKHVGTFVKRYNTEILAKLDPHEVMKEMKDLANSEDLLLLGYHTRNMVSDRHILSTWLKKSGYEVKEFDF